jgi:hypothetical protein
MESVLVSLLLGQLLRLFVTIKFVFHRMYIKCKGDTAPVFRNSTADRPVP